MTDQNLEIFNRILEKHKVDIMQNGSLTDFEKIMEYIKQSTLQSAEFIVGNVDVAIQIRNREQLIQLERNTKR